jgi:hypothetical protein
LIDVWRADVEPAIYKISRKNDQFNAFFHHILACGINHGLIYTGFGKIGLVTVTPGVAML